jgi:hypothetical protein
MMGADETPERFLTGPHESERRSDSWIAYPEPVKRFGTFGLVLLVACTDAPATPEPDASADGSAPDAAASDAGLADASDAGDAGPTDPFPETLVGNDVPAKRVGMFYLVWHAPAAAAMDAILSQNGTPLNLEQVIRSNGAAKYADVYEKWGVEGKAVSLYWMAKPKLGYYCIYRARPNETGAVPDCKNIGATLGTHAAQLVGAGIDHVVIDATNLIDVDPGGGDLLQRRPIEVLFEEWAKLRAQGKKTPQIAVWNAIPPSAVQWQSYLALYQKPEYDGLILHDAKTKKKVFFAVDSQDARAPDPAKIAAFQNAGIEVQRMWTIASTNAAVDRWAFMSYCQAAGKDTTSIVGAGACDQPWTPKSTLGSAVAVAPSFQTGYGSLPWGAAGKLGGLTFRRQWATAFAHMPDWVFVSGWNELVAQPQPSPYGSDPFAKSVGLERDPEGGKLFVDTFGAELGRDIEPTEEYGSAYYDLLQSCTRVFRSNVAKSATGCNFANEPCCATDVPYVNVWALRHDGLKDVLLTTSVSEKTSVLGNGYREVCSRYGTPSVFCVKAAEASTPLAPFVIHAAAAPGRKALYRCLVSPRHFYSLDPQCEGQTAEAPIGFLAQAPTGEMPRRLERCFDGVTGEHTLSVGFACPAGTTDEGTLGFVR